MSYVPFSRRQLLQSGLSTLGLCSLSPLLRADSSDEIPPVEVDPNSPSIVYHPNRCEKCGECSLMCRMTQTVYQYPTVDGALNACVHCGLCTTYCPQDALTERYQYTEVARILKEKKNGQKNDLFYVALLAPSLPTSIGEMYGDSLGIDRSADLIEALRQAGFDRVFNAAFAADVTIMEESAELIRRLEQNEAPLPLFTSCCPAWVEFARLFFPRWNPNVSSVKSPIMILGALIKSYYAQKYQIDPKSIRTIAFTPCAAKKQEILLPSSQGAGRWHDDASLFDIDYALTTRETAYLLNEMGCPLSSTPKENASPSFDSLLADSSGLGVEFGRTGGVAESLLRTAYYLVHGDNPPKEWLDTETIRDMKSLRTLQVELCGRTLRAAIVHGLGNARKLLEKLDKNQHQYDIIEVMACRGGCLGGGGQPKTAVSSRDQLRKERAAGLEKRSDKITSRLCHENPEVQTLYREFLKEANSKAARTLLHRS